VENVINEMRAAKGGRFFAKMVRFHDDDFLMHNINWLNNFSYKYTKEINLPFTCFVHPGTVTKEKVECLRRAGCHDVEVGVQSISEDTRRTILNRNVSQEQLAGAVDILMSSGLKIITDNILGLPGQKTSEMLDLLRFYNNNRVMKVYCFGFRYYPKTAIVDQLRIHTKLTDLGIHKLEEGINAKAFIQGGDWWNREIKQLQTYFAFFLYFSKFLNDFIIRHKLFKLFPALPYSISIIFSNWLRIPYKYNWALHITISRYRNYIAKVL